MMGLTTATISRLTERDFPHKNIFVLLTYLAAFPILIIGAPTGETYLTRNKRSHGHHVPSFHAPGLSFGVRYPQVMHFSAEDHHGHSVKLNYHRHNMLNHMQKEHHLHRDHIKHVVDHHLNDHLHHNHFNFKTKHHLPFHTVLHRFHYKHHDTHHKANLHNKLFYSPQMYNAYAFVKDHHHHHNVEHNKHHHHYPAEHHHDSSHGHLKMPSLSQAGQANAMYGSGAQSQQPDYTMMNAEPQMQLPMVQQPGMDSGAMMQPSGMDQTAMIQQSGMNPSSMMQPMGMNPSSMMQPMGMDPSSMMQPMGMDPSGMMQPGMSQNGMSQNGMMPQSGMMQPGMMPPGAINTQMQPMSMQGIQPGGNPSMIQPTSYMQNNAYMMQAGYNHNGISTPAQPQPQMMNNMLPNQAMDGQQPSMMGAQGMLTMGQNPSMMATGGEQPNTAQLFNAEASNNDNMAANTNDATQGGQVGTDKKFF